LGGDLSEPRSQPTELVDKREGPKLARVTAHDVRITELADGAMGVVEVR